MKVEAYVQMGCGTLCVEIECPDDADENKIHELACDEIQEQLGYSKLATWRKQP